MWSTAVSRVPASWVLAAPPPVFFFLIEEPADRESARREHPLRQRESTALFVSITAISTGGTVFSSRVADTSRSKIPFTSCLKCRRVATSQASIACNNFSAKGTDGLENSHKRKAWPWPGLLPGSTNLLQAFLPPPYSLSPWHALIPCWYSTGQSLHAVSFTCTDIGLS